MKRIGLIAAMGLILLASACNSGSPAAPTKAPAAAATATSAPSGPAATAAPAAPAGTATSAPPKATAPAGQPTATPFAGVVVTAGPLGGEITKDTIWTRAGSPYLVKDSVNVAVGVTLIIEPGVEIRFAQNTGLNATGKVRAMGTVTQPITLTADGASPYKGWWSGLSLNGSGAAADLDYVTVRWAGYSRNGSIEGQSGATINFNHGLVSDGKGSGVYTNDKAVANVLNSQLNANEEFPVEVDDGSVTPKLEALSVKSNGNNALAFGHGILSGARTWKNLGIPYVMKDGQQVPAGAVLTVEPGVEVRWAQNTGLDVIGAVKALGTATQPITFTAEAASPYKGWWSGISLNGSGAKADLDYVAVIWGGYSRDGSIQGQSGAVINLNHGVVSDGRASGVYTNDKAVANVSNTKLANNDGYGLECDDVTVAPQLASLTITGNGNNAIAFGNGVLSGERTWKNLGAPYVIKDTQVVPPGAILIVEPGVEVRFVQNTGLTVNGTLKAVGAAGKPIVFTAEGAGPYRGWWSGLTASGGSASLNLDYVTVRWGGYSRNGSVEVQAGAKATISHSIIRDSNSAGVYVETKGAGVTVSNTQFIENDDLGVENGDPSSVVVAANNWWGSASGPTADDNPGGSGSGVSAGVTYKPFLTAAP